MNTITKFLDRLAERTQMWLRRYEMPVLMKRKLDDGDCEKLQAFYESGAWEIVKMVRDNINWERNARAKSFCDGRTFVEFKKMEGTDEFLDIIEEIVKIHKSKTLPMPEPVERPRKISEYVPR